MKRGLLFTHTDQIAGAEKIVAAILGEEGSIPLELAVLKKTPGGRLKNQKATGGLRNVFSNEHDVIHSHLFLPGLLTRIYRIFNARAVWIHTVHYAGYEGQRFGRAKRFFDRLFIFASADHLIAVSPSVHKSLAGFKNVSLIENSLALADLSRAAVPGGEGLRLGTLSMLRPEKGLDELLLAAAELMMLGKTFSLRIAGEGPERQKLERRIADLGLSGRVELLGYVHDTSSFFRELDIFILPSKTESFGFAALEAMQFGLPLVAAEVGHLPTLFGHGKYGRLIARDENFVPNLARGILDVAVELEEWGARARSGLSAHRAAHPNSMATAYHELYRRSLLGGVCMIAPIVTQAVGGIQKQMRLQSRELARSGYKVYILQRRDPTLTAERQRALGWGHVEFISLFDPLARIGFEEGFLQRVRGVLFIVFGFFALARRRREIKILHAHQLFSPTLLATLCRAFFDMKVVVKVTASGRLGEVRQLRGLPFFGLRKRAFRMIDQVIVLTDEMQSEVKELGLLERQITLLPNCVEAQDVGDLQAATDHFEILYCGRISQEKSLATLLEAGRRLAARGIKSTIRLVGGTHGGRDVRAELEAIAATLPPECRCVFAGHVDDVRAVYLAAHVFVLPSTSEGMSNALLEAMSYGLPCVASDIRPNSFVIRDGTDGLLFRCEDAGDLSLKLEKVYHDPALARELSRQALETVKRRFSAEAISKRIASIYSSVRSAAESEPWV